MNYEQIKLECLRLAHEHQKPSAKIVEDAHRYLEFFYPEKATKAKAVKTKKK